MRFFGKIGLLALTIFLSLSPSHASLKININCPLEFIGTVHDVRTSSLSSLSKHMEMVDVTFKVKESLKGPHIEEKSFSVLKHGPNQFQVGESYQVSSSSEWLCKADKVN